MHGNDYAQARKQYVEEVRRSFQHALQTGTASFFKVRLLIAVCIFAAFVLCDRTGSRFYNYTTKEVVSMLKQERFQTQLDAIREAWNSLSE